MRRFYKAPYNRDGSKIVFNMGFHPTFLYIFPMAWVVSLPFNFLVDSIVLLIGFKIFGKEKVWHNWKKSILLSWVFGYVSDLIAAFLMVAFEFAAGHIMHGSVMANPFGNPFAFVCTLFSVLVAGFLIYIFNAKVALRKTELDDKAKKKVALLMAIVTMPYLFFMPVQF
ncbi:MAG: hypothetical protein J5777_00665 [Clostridiales bacterium]|nr:hypothetical protein [Clostridiales bacterium]